MSKTIKPFQRAHRAAGLHSAMAASAGVLMNRTASEASATAEGLGAAESLGAPLLGDHTAAPSEAPEGSCADVAEMEEGRPGGQDATEQQERQPIQQLLWTTPGEAVHLLETRGCAKLGSFRVQDTTLMRLLKKDEVLTLGAAERDLDWEAMWRAELAKDDRPSDRPKDLTALLEVEAWVVDVRDAAGADDAGILNPMLHRFKAGILNINCFGLPAVKAVVTFKWTVWQRFLHIELACYLLWLFAFQTFVLIFQDENTDVTLAELARTPWGAAALACEALALVGMAPFLYIEAATLREYGPRGWTSAWNAMDIVAYAVQIAITVMHLGRLGLASNTLSVLVAFQVLLLWVKAQYFARALQPAKNPFLDTLKTVVVDIRFFLFLLLLTVWGFACAFYILFRRDQSKHEAFANIGVSMLTMVNMLAGGVDLTMFNGTHTPRLGLGLLMIYWFCMSMVLLNCLIAIMADACIKVNQKQAERFLCGRCELMDELETAMPAWLRRRHAAQWNPAWVHFLQVTPGAADKILVDADDPMTEDNNQGPTDAQRLDALEAKVGRMLAVQEALARRLLGPAEYYRLGPPLSEDGDKARWETRSAR